MVNYREQRLNHIFSALSDPTRRAMLKRLGNQSMSVADLAEPFDMTKSAITKHLKVLEKAGLLNRSIVGRIHYCSLEPKPLLQATKWMKFYESFWNEKFNALEKFLSEDDKNDN